MTEHKHGHIHNKSFEEICDYLGGDIDSPFCKEVREHLESCPECKVYLDSIKKTVYMYRENEKLIKTPKDCKEDILHKVLSISAKK